MNLFPHSRHFFSAIVQVAFIGLSLAADQVCAAQDVPIGAMFVCNGEHIYVENCNIRDLSDNGTCMVAHPDHLTPTGLNSYTTLTRGALKKLLPTCQQPTAKQLAASKAFQQRQQDLYNANEKKANDQLDQNLKTNAEADAARAQSFNTGGVRPPKTPEERLMRRCVSSGRLPASCTGNSLLGWFSGVLNSVAPGLDKQTQPESGPNMAGVFQGAGNWRLDFIDGGVLVNCASLSPNQESYSIKFEANRTDLVIDTKPKPLVLTVHPDGTITGPGPVTINGVVASGYVGGAAGTGATQKDQFGNLYDAAGNRVPGNANAGHTVFASRTAACPALNLSSKGASVGAQTMQTDLLKTMLGGDKGAPTPPGIRMHGIFAAATGFSVQFYPESVILGCGPDVARAYPYTVVAEGSGAVVRINAPDHPLDFRVRPDGSLDSGSSAPYQVHGRIVTGQDDNGDFTFAPMEQTCNLAVLTPSRAIPASGGATLLTASGSGAAPNNGSGLATPTAPLGNAVLTIVAGIPAAPGTPSPFANRPYILLRSGYGDVLAQAGVVVPGGMSPYKYAGIACGTHTPDCSRISQAVQASAASAVRADASGNGTFPGVPPGTYHLMISGIYNKQGYVWGQAVQLHTGQNSITLDLRNGAPIN